MSLFISFVIVPAVFIHLMLFLGTQSKKATALLGILSSAFMLIASIYYCNAVALPGTPILEYISVSSYRFAFNADSTSTIMLLLTAILSFGVNLLAPTLMDLKNKEREFYILATLMQMGLAATYLAFDLISFYIAWEVVLIPAFLLIGIWGGQNRIKATVKFFLYTLAGSLFMLVAFAILMMHVQKVTGGNEFLFSTLYKNKLEYTGMFSTQGIVGLCLLFAFFIKAPLIPFHGWLRDTYLEAPTLVTAIIAGVMGKMGIYGLIRFMPMFPDLAKEISSIVMIFAAVGIVYGIFSALQSKDIKEIVSYASLSHVSALVFGLFTLNQIGISGAIMQMFNHGLLIAGLFIVVAYLEKKSLLDAKGLTKIAPVLSTSFFILTLGAIALPLTNGFVGESMILLGGFQAHRTATYIALLGTVFGAVVMLRVYSQYMFGASDSKLEAQTTDVQGSLKAYLIVLSIIVIVTGVYPHSLFQGTEAFVNQTMTVLFTR